MHAIHPGATFQVASQFNCLEFPSARVLPEDGISNYQYDNTQGPACAMACGAGTVIRNYFVPIFRLNDGTLDTQSEGASPIQYGQSKNIQLNNLDSLEKIVQNEKHKYWYVQNGYTFSEGVTNIQKFSATLATKSPSELDDLLGEIKVGLQRNVGVTFASRYIPLTEDVRVTQVFCSALSCAYSGIPADNWAPLAGLVLDANYEATLLAAVLNAAEGRKRVEGEEKGNSCNANEVYLTFIGGGVFGNRKEWIGRAIGRALSVVEKQTRGKLEEDLHVYICHYGRIDSEMQTIIQEAQQNF